MAKSGLQGAVKMMLAIDAASDNNCKSAAINESIDRGISG
jgi:hypothetical protein